MLYGKRHNTTRTNKTPPSLRTWQRVKAGMYHMSSGRYPVLYIRTDIGQQDNVRRQQNRLARGKPVVCLFSRWYHTWMRSRNRSIRANNGGRRQRKSATKNKIMDERSPSWAYRMRQYIRYLGHSLAPLSSLPNKRTRKMLELYADLVAICVLREKLARYSDLHELWIGCITVQNVEDHQENGAKKYRIYIVKGRLVKITYMCINVVQTHPHFTYRIFSLSLPIRQSTVVGSLLLLLSLPFSPQMLGLETASAELDCCRISVTVKTRRVKHCTYEFMTFAILALVTWRSACQSDCL